MLDTKPLVSMSPFFRWAGSKRKLLPLLLENIPSMFNKYVEPFCGSASLFFALAPSDAILFDSNTHLINAYKQIRKSPELICSKAQSLDINKETYLKIRAYNHEELSPVENAVRFIFLNRLCFNGVYRTNKAGHFNVPMGSRTGRIPNVEQFINCSNALKMAQINAGDFENSLAYIKEGDFVYLDPPYMQQSTIDRGEYGLNAFKYSDIYRLIRFIKRVEEKGAFFLLSYVYDEEVIKMFPRNWDLKRLNVSRNIASNVKHRKDVTEIIVANYPLNAFSWTNNDRDKIY